MMANMTDTDVLDYLQGLTVGYGKGWILRPSVHGRGMRLHETSQEGATQDVRVAILAHKVENPDV